MGIVSRAGLCVNDRDEYQIVDLRPGTYAVTFSLPGFATVQREGLEISGGGVTTVNAEMRVSGVAETIRVSGATPVVDVQTSTKRETVLSNEFVRALPAARGYGNYLDGVPGISGTGLGASATPSDNFFTSRGGRNSEGNIQLNGMTSGRRLAAAASRATAPAGCCPPRCCSRAFSASTSSSTSDGSPRVRTAGPPFDRATHTHRTRFDRVPGHLRPGNLEPIVDRRARPQGAVRRRRCVRVRMSRRQLRRHEHALRRSASGAHGRREGIAPSVRGAKIETIGRSAA
jgi:hypothetical protein